MSTYLVMGYNNSICQSELAEEDFEGKYPEN